MYSAISRILALLISKHSRLLFVILTLLILLSGYLTFLAVKNADFRITSSMIDKNNPIHRLYLLISQRNPMMNAIYIIVSASSNDQLTEAILELKRRLLSNKKMIKDVFTLSNSSNNVASKLLIALPAGSIEDITYFLALGKYVKKIAKKVSLKYKEVNVIPTGMVIMGTERTHYSQKNIGLLTLLTFVLVLLISFIGLRNFYYPLLAFVPIIYAVLLTYATTYILGITLTFFSLIVPMVLFGIGIDYAIHLGARYAEVVTRYPDLKEYDKVFETLDPLMKPLVLSCITTALALSAMGISGIPQMRIAGLLIAISIIYTLISTVIIMPLILITLDKVLKKAVLREVPTPFLSKLYKVVIIPTTLVVLALLSLGYILVNGIEIEKDFMALQPKEMSSMVAFKKIMGHYGFSIIDATVFVLPSMKLAGDLVVYFSKSKIFSSERWFSPYTIYNTLNILKIRDENGNVIKWDGTLKGWFKIKSKLLNLGIFRNIPEDNLLKFMFRFGVESMILPDNRVLVIAYPKVSIWNDKATKLYLKEVDYIKRQFNAEATGLPLMWANRMQRLLYERILLPIVALIVIFVVGVLAYRSFFWGAMTIIPLVGGIAVTLAIGMVLGIKLNIANATTLPLIIGIAVDDAFHIISRYLHTKDIDETLLTSGRAITLTTLTTLAAFFSFLFSVFPSLRSMGVYLVIGISSAYLYTIAFLPVIVRVKERKV